MAIVVLIVLATFVLEDAAIAGAAILATMGLVDPTLALASLIFGIFAGDLGLYALGAATRRLSWTRGLARHPHLARSAAWLRARAGRTLILARFLPGFRLPIYVASGMVDISLPLFAVLTLSAGLVWTVVIFETILLLGQAQAEELRVIAWIAAAALLLGTLLVPRIIARLWITPKRGSK